MSEKRNNNNSRKDKKKQKNNNNNNNNNSKKQKTETKEDSDTNDEKRGLEGAEPLPCPICLDKINIRTVIANETCLHAFCYSCLKGWISAQLKKSNSSHQLKQSTCPMCRATFTQIYTNFTSIHKFDTEPIDKKLSRDVELHQLFNRVINVLFKQTPLSEEQSRNAGFMKFLNTFKEDPDIKIYSKEVGPNPTEDQLQIITAQCVYKFQQRENKATIPSNLILRQWNNIHVNNDERIPQNNDFMIQFLNNISREFINSFINRQRNS